MSVPRITQKEYDFYVRNGQKYVGYVDGLGMVTQMNHPIMISYDNGQLYPNLATIPAVDVSPEAVIRSHLNLSDKIYSRLVKDEGSFLDVNCGQGEHKKVEKGSKAEILLSVVDQDEKDSKLRMRVSVSNDLSDGWLVENEYDLNALYLYFPDVNWTDLYTPSYGIQQEEYPLLDITDRAVSTLGEIQFHSSNIASLAQGGREFSLAHTKLELIMAERKNLQYFVDGQGYRRPYFSKKDPTKFSKYATKQRFERHLKANRKALWNGTDIRVRKEHASVNGSGLTKFCKALNFVGVGVSIYELISFKARGLDEENPNEYKLLWLDLGFSFVSFIPYAGWIISGIWGFSRMTGDRDWAEGEMYYDELPHAVFLPPLDLNEEVSADDESDVYYAGRKQSIGRFSYEMGCSGMRRDNTVSKPFDEEVIRQNIEYENMICEMKHTQSEIPGVTAYDIYMSELRFGKDCFKQKTFIGMPKGPRY